MYNQFTMHGQKIIKLCEVKSVFLVVVVVVGFNSLLIFRC